MFPSMPQDDAWDPENTRDVARAAPKRPPAGFYGAVPEDESPAGTDDPDGEEEFDEEIEFVPVRRQLSLAIAGFGGLLAVGLALGAQTSAPDSRWPYAVVLFGIQLLYVLAWTMAVRPPAAGATGGVCAAVALVADYLSVHATKPGITPLLYVAVAGFVVALVAQVFRAEDRSRITDSWRSTLAIEMGVVAYAIPIVLTRQPVGTQTIVVCAASAGVALLIARVVDAAFPKPRIALQVPRGATGVIVGAMLGTLAAAGLGSVIVYPFTPAKGAIVGLVAAVVASLVDLAVNFGEAGRTLAGDAPTFWVARHMQGPLGALALTAPAAYLLTHLYMT